MRENDFGVEAKYSNGSSRGRLNPVIKLTYTYQYRLRTSLRRPMVCSTNGERFDGFLSFTKQVNIASRSRESVDKPLEAATKLLSTHVGIIEYLLSL